VIEMLLDGGDVGNEEIVSEVYVGASNASIQPDNVGIMCCTLEHVTCTFRDAVC